VVESNNGAMDDLPEPAPVRTRRGLLRKLGLALPASRGDRFLVGATLAAVIGVVGAAVSVLPEASTQTAEASDLPTLAIEPPTTTTLAPTTTTMAPAPAPQTQPVAPPPAKAANAPAAIVQVGEIRIPKIGLVHKVYEGISLTVINKGPGHWPGSAMPGQLGNAVFAGHRTTYSKPFNRLNELVPGDEISFTTADGTSVYRMTKVEIVKPTDVWIVDPTPDATITLFACHPPGSARQRIVIRGAFESATPA
jgi:sortase A